MGAEAAVHCEALHARMHRLILYPGFLDPERCRHLVKTAAARLAPSGLALRKTEGPQETECVSLLPVPHPTPRRVPLTCCAGAMLPSSTRVEGVMPRCTWVPCQAAVAAVTGDFGRPGPGQRMQRHGSRAGLVWGRDRLGRIRGGARGPLPRCFERACARRGG